MRLPLEGAEAVSDRDARVPDKPNSPKPVFRLAYETDLLAAPVDQWFRYAEALIDISHDYNGEKEKACLVLVPDFIDDAIGFYQPVAKVGDSGSTRSVEFRTLDSHGDGQKTGGATGFADVGGHGGPSDE